MYLTPVALGYLTQLIPAALISGYLLTLTLRRADPRHSLWLTVFFVALTGFIFTLFLEAVLPPTPRLYAVFLQTPLLSAAWICLLQFIYHFPALPPRLRREARVALFLSGLYALWETGYAVFRFVQLRAGVVEFRPDWNDYFLLLFLSWAPLISARQMVLLAPPEGRFWTRMAAAWRRPAGREARALRTFTLIFLFVAALSLFNLLRTFYLMSVAPANAGIAVGILVALFAFTLAYLNQRAETTSFMVKLAGVTLTAMLAIMGVVGWVIAPAYAAVYQPDLTAPRALRFTPDGRGGYAIAAIPFAFEADLGVDLRLDDGLRRGCNDPLDFTFPFYGQTHHAVHVCNDGAISLG